MYGVAARAGRCRTRASSPPARSRRVRAQSPTAPSTGRLTEEGGPAPGLLRAIRISNQPSARVNETAVPECIATVIAADEVGGAGCHVINASLPFSGDFAPLLQVSKAKSA